MTGLEGEPSMGAVSSLVALFPVWSVLSQLVAGLLLVGAQMVILRYEASRKHFAVVNEFLCSFVWVWWTMETVLLATMYSSTAGLAGLTARLVAYPLISHGAPNNLCTALYQYFNQMDPSRLHISRFCLSVVIELCAMALALLYCHYYWRLLGVMASTDHLLFLEIKLEYFLNTSLVEGCLSELFLSFSMFIPSIFIRRPIPLVVIDNVLVIMLIVNFRSLTGAFMNPVSALSCLLYWHDLSLHSLATHVIVFWLGPFIGSKLASLLYCSVHAGKQKTS